MANLDLEGIADTIEKVVSLAHSYGIGIHTNYAPSGSTSSNTVESTFLGDPNKFARGVETTKITSVTLDSNYIQFIKAVLGELGFSNAFESSVEGSSESGNIMATIIEETLYEYTEGDMIAIPRLKVRNTYAPVYKILDFSSSLTDTTEIKPSYFIKNLKSGGSGNWNDIAHHLVFYLIKNTSFQDLLRFMFASVSAIGYANYAQICKKNKVEPPNENAYVRIAQVSAKSQVVKTAGNLIKNQINHGIGLDVLAAVKAEGNSASVSSTVASIQTMSVLNNAYQAIKTRVENEESAKIIGAYPSHLIESQITKFVYGKDNDSTTDAGGDNNVSLVHVMNATYGVGSNGTVQEKRYEESLQEAERVITQLQPITAIVTTGDAVAKEGTALITLQIPCNNWTDIENMKSSCPKSVTQISTSKIATYPNVMGAVNVFSSLVACKSLKSTRVQYNPLSSKCSIEYSYNSE